MAYGPFLCVTLLAVASFYVLAQVYCNQMYYVLKASWSRVALNLQVIVTFVFDIFVAKVSFSEVEIAGCALLLSANIYLFLSDIVFPQPADREEDDEVQLTVQVKAGDRRAP